MAKPDPQIAAHLEWLGFVRPTGLVVSAPALVRAGAILDRRDTEGQRLLRDCSEERGFRPEEEPRPCLPDFRAFASAVLGWNFSPKGYAGTDEAPIPPELEAVLPDSGEILRPDFAVRTEPLRSVPAVGSTSGPGMRAIPPASRRAVPVAEPASAPSSVPPSLPPSAPASVSPSSPSGVGDRPWLGVREDAATYGADGAPAAADAPTSTSTSTSASASGATRFRASEFDPPPTSTSTPASASGGWQLLVRVCGPGEDFDRAGRGGRGQGRGKGNGGGSGNGSGNGSDSHHHRNGLEASPHGRMERLLRHTGVPAGLLFNGVALRLISAPRGESSGWLDFRVPDMHQTAGRPISTAMRLLLGQTRLLSVPRPQRLAGLLEESRKFQNEVSERLAEQVLHALYELLRGFQAAHDASKGTLLDAPLAANPDHIYRGLLTLVLRLVFLLYAEERDMLPQDDAFLGAYSLAGLHERLREDAALHPDTMDQRYGAYAQLLVLFRMVHDGARAGGMALPPRHGVLFDPDRYRFLEGRAEGGVRQIHERIEPPLVPDGAIHRVLEKLIVLDGERISYRALDVEHIGSVYETMMGFRLETVAGRSAAVRAAKKHGAPAAVDLEALLREAPAKRAKWIQDRTDRKLTDRVRQAVREADTVEALHAALDPVIDRRATPDLAPAGAMVLQPSEERRRSGSHYTPRELTEPIVRTTLEPILDRLRTEPDGTLAKPFPGRLRTEQDGALAELPPGRLRTEAPAQDGSGSPRRPAPRPSRAPQPPHASRPSRLRPPRPERILDLKICDPALGSGAFLVEACRQLGDALVESWRAHDAMPEIPPDENEVVFARRLVAQRCLYGVDRNPVALDLAKLSLWLITLAKEHPLTFLDHALLHGDSLVGLTRTQIEAFHWKGDAPRFQAGFEVMRIREHLAKIAALRERIRDAGEEVSDRERRLYWREVEDELGEAAVFGDLVLAAFFEKAKPKEREALRARIADAVMRGETHRYRSWIEELRDGEPPLAPFHWEIEFPEVFERENPGFDAIVGNPPFAGKNTVAAANAARYPDWLKQTHAESHGNADLVAHFFRRAFDLVRRNGAFGLIATNTIAQGDTRSTGLRWICEHGGEIYRARRRVKWPGLAAVVVSVLHVAKGWVPDVKRQDGEAAPDHGAGTSSAGSFPGSKRLDGEAVETITAFLFHRGGHRDPARLTANAGKSFQGSIVLGMGFTFDDTDKKGVASPLAEMRRLIENNPRNRQAIFPYIGGEEVNTSPTHAHHRYVINFRDWPLRREEKAWEAREGVGEVREEAGESWEGVGESWAEAGDHPFRREDGGESEDVGESWADAGDQCRRYPLRREGDGESEDIGELWADAGDQRRRYPPHREDIGKSWVDADEKRKRELRRQPIVPHDYPEPVAADWPELLAIVEERVKPERDGQNRKALRERWWHYAEKRPGLYATVAGLERVLAVSRVGQQAAFVFLPKDMVYAESMIIFPFTTHSAFCALQSRPHEIWARFFGSSMKDDLRYTPSDCFETFPFPERWETHPTLEAAGKAYYDFRAILIVRNGEGMTRTYNRFHDRDKDDPGIVKLRALHADMDHAVLTAYGWCDIATELTATGCDFLPDYAIDEEEWAGKKKPYRYRWPDAIRDEVLARLLELNADRAAEEARTGAVASGPSGRMRAVRPVG